MSITENITRLKASLPTGVTLVAVSKFHPVEALQEDNVYLVKAGPKN